MKGWLGEKIAYLNGRIEAADTHGAQLLRMNREDNGQQCENQGQENGGTVLHDQPLQCCSCRKGTRSVPL